MGPGERLLMGLLGAGSAVLLIDGLQNGVMLGDYIDYDVNERPIRFALAIMADVITIVICGVFAAGYKLEDVWNLANWLAMRA